MPLSSRQATFVARYIVDQNGTAAAIAAGYPESSAHVAASRLLKTAKVAEAIQSAMTRAMDRAELRAADVLEEIRKVAFVDLSTAYDDDGKLLPLKEMPADVRRSLVSMETQGIKLTDDTAVMVTKVKLADKLRALEMLAKHFKLLTDVQEVSGKNGGPQIILHLPANGSEKAPGEDETE